MRDPMSLRLRQDAGEVGARRERHDFDPVGVFGADLEGLDSDRAG
jgi:hypothetical protein